MHIPTPQPSVPAILQAEWSHGEKAGFVTVSRVLSVGVTVVLGQREF